jgi:hypothetical protein
VYKHIICAGFRDIRQQYPASFEADEEWPNKAQLARVAQAASGFFVFASSMLQFIADEDCSDPKGQLQRCLQFIDDTSKPRENNPLSQLYLSYQEILSDIDPDVLLRTTRILQLLTVQSVDQKFSVQHIADSLNMDLSTFHLALEGLQSVLRISPAEFQEQTIEFYHTSFANFLLHQVDQPRTKSLSHIQAISSSRSNCDNSDLRE